MKSVLPAETGFLGQTRKMGYFDELRTVHTDQHGYTARSSEAQWAVECSGCGNKRMLAIAVGDTPEKFAERGFTAPLSGWLMCVACGMGAYAIGTSDYVEQVFPNPAPFDLPKNLSFDVGMTWNEALMSFTATAYTSCALMCRKIIFHMAVEAGLPEKNEKNWAPSFEQCVNHLVKEELITKRQKDQWVDSIREWGNTATHDLAPIDKATAFNALEFTYQLLQMVYSFPDAAPGKTGKDDSSSPVPPQSSGQPH